MKSTRPLEMVLALAMVLGGTGLAHAQSSKEPPLNLGWDTPYGVLFSFQNPFAQQLNILSEYQGGIGAQYNLSPTTGVRLGFEFGRTSNTAVVETDTTTNTTAAGTTTVTTKDMNIPAGNTSSLDLLLSGSYVVRLGKAAVAPYVAGGASFGWTRGVRAYTDKTQPTGAGDPLVIEVDDSTNAINMGVHGLLGVDWRIHPSVSVYAEYGLGLTLFDRQSASTFYKESDAVAATSDENETGYTRTRWINFDTGMTQNGAIGVAVFF